MPEETATVKMLDGSRREILHTALQPPRWEGYQTGEYVIEMGQMCPPSTWYQVTTFAARATCGPGAVSAHGAACRP